MKPRQAIRALATLVSPAMVLAVLLSTAAAAAPDAPSAPAVPIPPAPGAAASAPPLPQSQVMPFAISREQGSVNFLVVDSVRPHDGVVDLQVLIVWAPPKPIDRVRLEQSLVSQRLDCKARTVERLSAAVYDTSGVGADAGDYDRTPAVPWPAGSGLESLSQTLCAGKDLDAKLVLDGGSRMALRATRYLLNLPDS